MQKPELIPFRGSTIKALPGETIENPKIIFRPAVKKFGMDYSAQYRRLKRQPWARVAVTATVGSDGVHREVVCIDLRTFSMWLATIETSRIQDEEVKKNVIAYQNEAADAIVDHFKAKYGPMGVGNTDTPASWPDLFRTATELQLREIQDLRGELSELKRDFYTKGLDDIDDARNVASVASAKVAAVNRDHAQMEAEQRELKAELKEVKHIMSKGTPRDLAAWKDKDLVEVHDSEAYRATHGTWADYAREVLGCSVSAAYARLAAARGKPLRYKRKPKGGGN